MIGLRYMLKSNCLKFAFLLSLLPSLAAAADVTSLSLESTILFALNQNPAVKAEMEKIKQTQFAIDEARSAYYPQISMSVKGGHEYNNPAGTKAGTTSVGKVVAETNSLAEDLVISQVLFNGFATGEEVKRRKALETSATYGSLTTIEGILQNAIQYYVDIWRYQRAVEESEAFVAELEKIGEKVKLMSEAGAESKAKKEYVGSRVAAAQTEYSKEKASLITSISNLESLTGSLPPFKAQRPLQLDPTARELESYYGLAHKDNNRLQLTRSDETAIEHQIKVQSASYLPTVNLEMNGRHGYDVGGNVGNTMGASAMVVVNYKIFDGFSRAAASGRLASQKAENTFSQRQIERDLDKDIRKYYNQILATKENLSSNMREVISSEILREMYEKQFELGEGDIITMIEGLERLHSARLNSFKLEASMVTDSYLLLQKAGALRKERFCASC